MSGVKILKTQNIIKTKRIRERLREKAANRLAGWELCQEEQQEAQRCCSALFLLSSAGSGVHSAVTDCGLQVTEAD